jgi:peroxiredoxin
MKLPIGQTLAVLLAVAAIGFIAIQTRAQNGTTPHLRESTKAPALRAGTWLNSKPTTIAANKGKVVVLTFWTFACVNCTRTVPFWNTWAKRYTGTDVTVLSVHTPELQFDRKPEKVREHLKKNGIMFPVLTDNDYHSWKAFGVQAWPTTILIDKQGRIRGRWEGELDWNNSGEYKRVEQAIESLRKEKS